MNSAQNLNNDISGIFLGTYAINPITKQKVPLYAANYVLNSYATGMVMGVPGHDERDYRFSQIQNIPIQYVIENSLQHNGAYEGDGKHINSPLINDCNIVDGTHIINEYLIKHKLGKKHISYKLKD
jgi:leucyl-tRNA synthetase